MFGTRERQVRVRLKVGRCGHDGTKPWSQDPGEHVTVGADEAERMITAGQCERVVSVRLNEGRNVEVTHPGGRKEAKFHGKGATVEIGQAAADEAVADGSAVLAK